MGVAAMSFIAAIYFTRRSTNEARKDIKLAMDELYALGVKTADRMEQLENHYRDSIGSLSPAATQNFSLAKQFLAMIERRAEKVEELLSTKKLEDLFKAHKLVASPVENAGDHLSSLVFASTVLQLQPSELAVAIDAMMTSVEGELFQGKKAMSFKSDGYNTGRKRKFTIRGFIQSVTGENPTGES